MRQMHLSARAYHRILKLARTIADLAVRSVSSRRTSRKQSSIGREDRSRAKMTTLFADTGPEAERVLIELLRQAPVSRKLEMLGQMNATARQLALQAYERAILGRLRRSCGATWPTFARAGAGSPRLRAATLEASHAA